MYGRINLRWRTIFRPNAVIWYLTSLPTLPCWYACKFTQQELEPSFHFSHQSQYHGLLVCRCYVDQESYSIKSDDTSFLPELWIACTDLFLTQHWLLNMDMQSCHSLPLFLLLSYFYSLSSSFFYDSSTKHFKGCCGFLQWSDWGVRLN